MSARFENIFKLINETNKKIAQEAEERAKSGTNNESTPSTDSVPAPTAGGSYNGTTYGDYVAGGVTTENGTNNESTPSTDSVPAPTESSSGAETPAPSPFLTYEEYIAQGMTPAEAANEVQRNNIYKAAEEQRVESERRAEVERDREIVDANSSYKQNLATYGANAEALAGMGLTGSGYGDYLNSRAYAQMRSDVQQAKAKKTKTVNDALYTEGQAKNAADSTYYSNLQTIADNKNKAYAELLNGANTGVYTADQIPELAKNYGLDGSQTESLIAAANDYETRRAEGVKASLGNDIGAINSAVAVGDISPDEGNNLISSAQENNFNNFSSAIDNGTVDISAIESAKENGEISTEHYTKLKVKWNSQISADESFFKNGVALLSKSDAQSYLNNYINHSWADNNKVNALKAIFEKLYTPITPSIKYNNESGKDNMSVIGPDGTIYRVQYANGGAECTDALVNEVAAGLSNDTVFGYNGNIYVKRGGKNYQLEKRKLKGWESHWTNLYAKFF